MSERQSDYILVPSPESAAIVEREKVTRALNSADYERIEAALRSVIPASPAARAKWHPKGLMGLTAFERTLNKIERINKTGEFTEQ